MSFGDENKISKLPAKVDVVMANGDQMVGYLFLRQGQRILDVLNDERAFLPLVLEDESVKFFHKGALHQITDLHTGDQHAGAGGFNSAGMGGGSSSNDWGRAAGSFEDGDMSIEQAIDILGLSRGYTREQVSDAHRRLIAKNHPDVGGSTFIASRINDAKLTLVRALKAEAAE